MISLIKILLNIWVIPSIILLLLLLIINYKRYKKCHTSFEMCDFLRFICHGHDIDKTKNMMSTINVVILRCMFIPIANILLLLILALFSIMLALTKLIILIFKIPYDN